MDTGHQVQNQIKWGRRKLEDVYISLDNKNGVSQELNWSFSNEADVQTEHEPYSVALAMPLPSNNHNDNKHIQIN